MRYWLATALLLNGDAAADHASGLHDRDPRLLERAAETPRNLWTRASAAEDLAPVLSPGDREAAVRHLDYALTVYGSTGASRDAARVRRRLRDLGIHSRIELARHSQVVAQQPAKIHQIRGEG